MLRQHNSMSRHQTQPQQSNYSRHPMLQHHPDMATTLPTMGRIELFKCHDITTTLWRHQNKPQPVKTLVERCRDIKAMSRHRISDVATSYQSSLGGETSPMSRHRINVATSATTFAESFITKRFNVATSTSELQAMSQH